MSSRSADAAAVVNADLPLHDRTLREIDEFWAHVFSTDAARLWRPGVHVSEHRPGTGFAAYAGIFVLVRGDACRITAPPALVEAVAGGVASWRAGQGLEPERWRALLGRATAPSGPSWQGYADRTTLRRWDTGAADVREVPWAETIPLALACGSDERDLAGFNNREARYFLLFAEGQPAAGASLTRWRHDHDEVTVLTHPDHRGRGHGAAVAGVAAGVAVEAHGISRYRAHLTNRASLAIGARIGYREYATQLSVVPGAD